MIYFSFPHFWLVLVCQGPCTTSIHIINTFYNNYVHIKNTNGRYTICKYSLNFHFWRTNTNIKKMSTLLYYNADIGTKKQHDSPNPQGLKRNWECVKNSYIRPIHCHFLWENIKLKFINPTILNLLWKR